MSASETGKAAKVALFLLVVAAAAAFVYTRPPIAQLESNHTFADARTMYRVRNAVNVGSNVLYMLVGFLGLRFLGRGPTLDPEGSFRPGAHTAFESYRERPAYAMFFASVIVVALGSAFYHLAPSSQRLFWDRLPTAMALMALFTTVFAERISIYWSRILLLPLVFAGVASVVAWRLSEQRGGSDLRAYLFVQGLAMIGIPLMMLLFRSRYSHGWMILFSLALFGAAKALAQLDAAVFAASGGVVSGHSLGHVAAALGAYVPVSMLKRRGLSTDWRPGLALELADDDDEDEDDARASGGEE